MYRFYYPTFSIHHLEELVLLAGLRAAMQPGEVLYILPSSRIPYILPAAQDEGFSFDIPRKFYDGRYFYFYANRFTPEQLEQLSMYPPKNNVYDHIIVCNSVPNQSYSKAYFLALKHTKTSKSILKAIRSYHRPNNQLVDLDIHLLPHDLVTILWKNETVKQMQDILYSVQNANAYFLTLTNNPEIEDFLFLHNKRFSSFQNQSKSIADYHALFSSKVVISLQPKILDSLGMQPIPGNAYYYSIHYDNHYFL
jgi:hypothetical protein